MQVPTYADSFKVLCLQLASEGRAEALLGTDVDHACACVQPFLVGPRLPDVYLEFPLAGTPFMDVTLLYGDMPANASVNSPAAGDARAMFEWYSNAREEHEEICCGFELDTHEDSLPPAAVHFQPRANTDLVLPFCETVGEAQKGELYLAQNERMPKGWPLSFFGMFRGRPGSPLRVCGYLSREQQRVCGEDPAVLRDAFDAMGFDAYDDAMLAQVSQLMATTPGVVDFQLDVWPNGQLGDTFAIDCNFAIQRPELVRQSFAGGMAGRVMSLLEQWGAADERWRLAPRAAFARALPVELDDGSLAPYGFTLMPQWAKVRWRGGVLQASKLYYLGNAQLVADAERKGA